LQVGSSGSLWSASAESLIVGKTFHGFNCEMVACIVAGWVDGQDKRASWEVTGNPTLFVVDSF
jgi:hypothetical protein